VVRTIVAFHPDAAGDWVAELDCGHTQHVRHRPPFQERPWVLDAAGRAARVGTPAACRRCDEVGAEEGRVDRDAGGDPACWAGLLCPACGAVLPGDHRGTCRAAAPDEPPVAGRS
jgi:hypothetical protein